jgi:predicted  nucleic acid-binding Zn-ribbon protein
VEIWQICAIIDSMTDELASHTLELLRQIRSSTERMESDLHDVKMRLTNVEEGLAGVNRRLDRTDQRLFVIEKRLGLVDA